MRKFSVLLIGFLFFVPVISFGIMGDSLAKPISLIDSIKELAPMEAMLSLKQNEIVKLSAFFSDSNGSRDKMIDKNTYAVRPNTLSGFISPAINLPPFIGGYTKSLPFTTSGAGRKSTYIRLRMIPDWIKEGIFIGSTAYVTHTTSLLVADTISFLKE